MDAEDTAILIPAHNDDYCLDLCLESLAGAVDARIIVLENGSTDDTFRVAAWWQQESPLVEVHSREKTLNYAEGRRRLQALTDARHLIFIDSDFVLIEDRADELRDIVEDPARGLVVFRHCQMVGDFFHVGRAHHTDRSHCYVDHDAFRDFEWSQTRNGFLRHNHQPAAKPSALRLFWHLNCVRPDHRLAARLQDRTWFTGEQKERPADRAARMPDWKLHDLAMERLYGLWRKGLLRHRDDASTPPLPRVIQDRMPGRFEMMWEDGEPVDRKDIGWTPPWDRDHA